MERWGARVCHTCKGTLEYTVWDRGIGFPYRKKVPCDNPECELGTIYSGDAMLAPDYVRDLEEQHREYLENVDSHKGYYQL